MSILGVSRSRDWILTLFIRDDGERFLLGDGDYEFSDSQTHFVADSLENDTVEVQGGDGVLLAGQVRRPSSQEFEGRIGSFLDSKPHIEQLRRKFLAFFAKNHFYKAVFVFADGSAIQKRRGFLVDSPEVQEIDQLSPEYHVALNFEDVNYYEYAEEEDGREAFTSSFSVAPGTTTGGAVWTEGGLLWTSDGIKWDDGTGGVTDIEVSGTGYIYPVITISAVESATVNPTVENVSTGSVVSYAGTIAQGQELVIDCGEKTAKLDGLSVVQNISGGWLSLAPGANEITYSNSSGVDSAMIKFNAVVG